jgi:AcrR family transcriptional regulator
MYHPADKDPSSQSRKNTANLIVRENITEALLKLMKKKDFAHISVSELTQTAGVGRVSFYRNFVSKEDVLQQYMAQIGGSWWREHHEENPATLWKMTFEIFELLKPTLRLLHKSHMDSIVFDFIKASTKAGEADTPEEGYRRAMFAGLAFGLYDQWASTGMKETSEELTAMFREVALPYSPKPIKDK